jgi:hypothetical protein
MVASKIDQALFRRLQEAEQARKSLGRLARLRTAWRGELTAVGLQVGSALGANAVHGKQREPGDYTRAFHLACKHGLVATTNTLAVQHLLRCTTQWAYPLTEAARAYRPRWRVVPRSRSVRRRGQSTRAIAHEVGVDQSTVRKTADAKLKQTAWPAAVGTASVAPSNPRSAAMVTARFGVAGSMRGRFAARGRDSKPTNWATRDNRYYRA